MTSQSHRARRRARWALWTLVGVNVVTLWFFVGATASLTWHAKILDDETLRACTSSAMRGQGWLGGVDSLDDATFVGPATVRFTATVAVPDFEHDASEETTESVEVECRVRVRDDDAGTSEGLVVDRAEVVR